MANANLSDEEIASIYVVCQWARSCLEKPELGQWDRRKQIFECIGQLEAVSRRLGYPGHTQNYELMQRLGWVK